MVSQESSKEGEILAGNEGDTNAKNAEALVWKLAAALVIMFIATAIAGNTKLEVISQRVDTLNAWQAAEKQMALMREDRSRDDVERFARVEGKLEALTDLVRDIQKEQRAARTREQGARRRE